MDNKELIKNIELIAKEKGIETEIIFEALTLGLAAAYKKNFDSLTNVKVEVDRNNGDIKVMSYLEVVKDVDEVPDDANFDAIISLEEAKEKYPKAKAGDVIEEEITPKDFGRIAASTAKQVVTQKIREAERESISTEFSEKEGELLVGIVTHEDVKNYFVDLGRTTGILPKTDIIPGETIKIGASLKVYVMKLEMNNKGPLILLSRRHYNFVKRLFELEIPELADGTILIHGVAREPGMRSKVAVYSENQNVDPIGACVGEKGMRISRVIKELNGEKIDLIEYSSDPETFISNALAPARNVSVYVLDKKNSEALAIIDKENLSLAIGKKGQNVKLAARLTHYKIDVKNYEEAREMGIAIEE